MVARNESDNKEILGSKSIVGTNFALEAMFNEKVDEGMTRKSQKIFERPEKPK